MPAREGAGACSAAAGIAAPGSRRRSLWAFCAGWAIVFDSKELTNSDRFAGIAVMRQTAILKHKEKGHFNLNTQAN